MKRIEAIIRPTKAGRVCAALERVGHSCHRISQIEERGREGSRYLLRGAMYKVDFAAKSKIELIAEDSETRLIVEAIREAAFSGDPGDGEIIIYPMEDAVHIRSGGRETTL